MMSSNRTITEIFVDISSLNAQLKHFYKERIDLMYRLDCFRNNIQNFVYKENTPFYSSVLLEILIGEYGIEEFIYRLKRDELNLELNCDRKYEFDSLVRRLDNAMVMRPN